MGRASTIGLDVAKRAFQAHGADATGRVVFRKRLARAKVLEFFAAQPPCVVALEACGGSHHWARGIGKLGHTQRFLSSHAFIHGHFHPRRHLMSAAHYRRARAEAFRIWRQETCVQIAA